MGRKHMKTLDLGGPNTFTGWLGLWTDRVFFFLRELYYLSLISEGKFPGRNGFQDCFEGSCFHDGKFWKDLQAGSHLFIISAIRNI